MLATGQELSNYAARVALNAGVCANKTLVSLVDNFCYMYVSNWDVRESICTFEAI